MTNIKIISGALALAGVLAAHTAFAHNPASSSPQAPVPPTAVEQQPPSGMGMMDQGQMMNGGMMGMMGMMSQMNEMMATCNQMMQAIAAPPSADAVPDHNG